MADINRHCFHRGLPIPNFYGPVVSDLASAMSEARKGRVRDPIFVTFGLSEDDVRDQLPPEHLRSTIVVLDGKRISESLVSSVIVAGPVVAVKNEILEAMRKLQLHRKVARYAEIRPLVSEEDFRGYFALRYQVWSKLGYLQKDRDCANIEWEVDFTDRSTEAIGAFANDGQIIGCVRLVFDKNSAPNFDVIDRVVSSTGDPILSKGFERPQTLRHPYNELDCLPHFLEVYQNWVRHRIAKAEVGRVIVKEEFRNNSLGEVLVDTAVAAGANIRLNLLFLACSRCHGTFYERSGFSKIKDPLDSSLDLSCDRYAQVNVPAIAMQRWLTKQ